MLARPSPRVLPPPPTQKAAPPMKVGDDGLLGGGAARVATFAITRGQPGGDAPLDTGHSDFGTTAVLVAVELARVDQLVKFRVTDREQTLGFGRAHRKWFKVRRRMPLPLSRPIS